MRAFYGQKGLSPVLGDASFRHRVRRRLGPGVDRPEVADARRIMAPPSLERIARLTAAAFGVDESELHVERRGRGAGNVARMVAMALGRHPGGHALGDIARHFGVGHYSSITAAARRLDHRMRDDENLAATVAELRGTLSDPPDEA